MRAGSGPAVGGSLGSVHKKVFQLGDSYEDRQPETQACGGTIRHHIARQRHHCHHRYCYCPFPSRCQLPTTLTQASWHTVKKSSRTCGRGAPAANGWRWPPTAAQTWWKRSSCRQQLGRSMLIHPPTHVPYMCPPMLFQMPSMCGGFQVLPVFSALHLRRCSFAWSNRPCPCWEWRMKARSMPAQTSLLPLTGYTYVPAATPVCEPPAGASDNPAHCCHGIHICANSYANV